MNNWELDSSKRTHQFLVPVLRKLESWKIVARFLIGATMSEPHTSGLICEFMWVYVCLTHFVCVQLQFNVKAVCCVRTMVQLLCLCLCGDLHLIQDHHRPSYRILWKRCKPQQVSVTPTIIENDYEVKTAMISRTFSPVRERILIQCFNCALVIFIREWNLWKPLITSLSSPDVIL